MAIPTIPDAAVGAIAAALIGGLLTFLGLVASKENKISEFRQAWIDAVRQDLAKMIASANAIRGASSVGFTTKEDLFKAIEKHFVDINQSSASIRLRLNQEEDDCESILQGIDQLERLMIDSSPIDIAACVACEREILEHSQKFLKSEWKRVRRGEPTFYITKWAGLAVIIAGITALVLVVVLS